MNSKAQPRKRLYHLPRTAEESHINNYNPALLLANQANVDVQYIAHLGSRLPYYITDYVTKNERSEQDEMWQEIFTTSKSLASNALSFMLRSVKNRQVGANEAADRLLGHKLFSKSRQLRFADLQHGDRVKRTLRPIEELQKIVDSNPDSQDIYVAHWVLDIYPDRPDELENCSLHEFMGWFEKVKCDTTDKKLALKHLPYVLRRRKEKPYIVTHQLVNPHTSNENQELYCYYMLKLFRPWRFESDLCEPDKTYHETFVQLKEQFPEMAAYHSSNVQINEEDKALEKAIQQKVSSRAADEEEQDIPEGALDGCEASNLQCAMDDLEIQHKVSMEKELPSIQQDYESLNQDQQRIVNNVVISVNKTNASIWS